MGKWLILLLAAGSSGAGTEAFHLGTWRIQTAKVAPWWQQSAAPEAGEARAWIGQTIVFAPGSIKGPGLLACRGPVYAVKNVPAEGLFQGMFSEMAARGQATSAVSAAASAGFRGREWATLTTGCDNEMDYHFSSKREGAFALDNYIYRLEKVR